MVPRPTSVKAEIERRGSEKRDYRNQIEILRLGGKKTEELRRYKMRDNVLYENDNAMVFERWLTIFQQASRRTFLPRLSS